MGDLFQEAVIISILAATVRIATPLLLAALGELITEKAGILNLGVEGMMLMGAFTGFLAAYSSGSLTIGILVAAVSGGMMGLIMAFMASTLKVEQIVTGIALNLLASGVTLFWYVTYFKGTTDTLPSVNVLPTLPIPLLSDIPYVGEILFTQKILTYVAFIMVFVVWFFLYRTRSGLELRCIGENPRVIDMKGLSVTKRQYAAVIFGGLMAGMAGAFLTLGTAARFVPEIAAGRGWLAIVIVIAGNWRPMGIVIASVVFAFLEAFQLQIQGVGVQIPYQLLLMMPYVIAILAMVFRRYHANGPDHLGRPYLRE